MRSIDLSVREASTAKKCRRQLQIEAGRRLEMQYVSREKARIGDQLPK
jgi:hypothetical protein